MDRGRTAVVMSPQRPDLVLTTNIPDVELDILHRHRLDVESNGRDGSDRVGELERVQNRSLASSIKSQHQNAHFPRPKELVDEAGETRHGVAHLGGCRCPRRTAGLGETEEGIDGGVPTRARASGSTLEYGDQERYDGNVSCVSCSVRS